ncbi:hypothetical protein OAX11_04385, partial [Flavobacteriaceae bacterium]|nr:hypothetical protein [Flavobacteriaceae bacterium]
MTKNIILRLLFIASFLMQAQEPVSIHLSEKNGLPDKEFYNIIEDNNGFIWLCADKGLYRYDGKVYKKYVHTLQRGLSVFGVQQDPLNRIWCNNISGQFFYLKDDKLALFIDLKKQLRGELADFVVNDTYLWVFARSNIYRVNLKTKAIKSTLKSEGYLGIPFSYNNSIYYQSKDSISSITSGNTTKNLLATHLPNRTKNNITIAQGKSKMFNIGTDLFLMQNRAQFNSFFKIENAKKSLTSVNGFEAVKTATIHSVFKNDDEIWIATSSGVWVYKYAANNFRLKKHLFKNVSITKVLLDKDNNYWFTSLNNGVYIIPNINIETSAISSENKHINSLDKVNDSILVYGLANGNVGLYNTHKHRNKIINLPTKDRVSALVYHPSNNIIISKDLSSYLLNYSTLEHVKKTEYLSIKSFSVVDNGDLLCTSYRNVRLIDRRDITLHNDRINKKRKNISDNKRTYTSFYNKIDKETYVAFVDGLVKYDSLWNSKIIQYKNTSIYGKSIAETSQGIVWIATFKNGVFGIKNDAVVRHYTTNNGLTSNNIEKIKADEDNLW